jgi:hypothetical protein
MRRSAAAASRGRAGRTVVFGWKVLPHADCSVWCLVCKLPNCGQRTLLSPWEVGSYSYFADVQGLFSTTKTGWKMGGEHVKTFTGTCHCGDVVFNFNAEEIVRGLRCNCSICKRIGAVMSMKIAPSDFRLLTERNCIKVYRFDDKAVHHSYCNQCGIYVFYEHQQQCRINLGCVDEVDTSNLEILYFDGLHIL